MNAAASGDNIVIIGIGNPLRGDDGLGRAVAERLAQESDTAGYDIRSVHQLTPELAQWMAAARLVILIDASYEGEPGDVRIRQLSSPAQPGAVGSHYATPEELAALTRIIYGQCPPVIIVTVTGEQFGLDEHLSPLIADKLPLVSAAVRHLCIHGLDRDEDERAPGKYNTSLVESV